MEPDRPEVTIEMVMGILDQMYVGMFGFTKDYERTEPGFFACTYKTPGGESITVSYDDGKDHESPS
jgi:hypothetical protein